MIEKLKSLEREFTDLEAQLADPQVIADQARYRTMMQRYSELSAIIKIYRDYAEVLSGVANAEEALLDPDLEAMAREELPALGAQRADFESRLERLLLPKDPFDSKNVIVEIRAAAGGGEASLFAAEIYNMYARDAERLGYKVELLDSYPTDVGGFSKLSFEILGAGAYSKFKYESGVHRVQRVPETETQGRIHTSTVTVAVLPEAEDVDVALSPADYRVDVFRSSGPGGQSVNTTDSAVRITFKPGSSEEIVVSCQDGKSQIKNKEKALTVLRSRLLEREMEKAQAEAREARLVQIGSGERSEKIRTYNFPQSRVTDHRIGYTSHNLSDIMLGGLSELTLALSEAEQGRRLDEMSGETAGAVAGATGGAA
ncbi:peptide chain release factor 1 [soil metagenome]